MNDRTTKLKALRRDIENSLSLIVSSIMLADVAASGGDGHAPRTRDNSAALVGRECSRARQLIDEFIEVANA